RSADSICGEEWGRQFTKFFFFAYFQNIDQVIASEFTRKGAKGQEALDSEEYWAKSYVISTYFSKLANTYKQMDEKTLYDHFYKLASALFKYIPEGNKGNLKEYLKKVSQDMNERDKTLFTRFMGYLGKMKGRNKEEQAIIDRFYPEMQGLVPSDKELEGFKK
ncbi:MAG: hypothetical protein EBS19_14560, partial [Spirochaetia bacterium]|nr:hypothetical protein [Spirochaetia bacterium]